MKAVDFNAYSDAIEILEAQEALLALRIADNPHAKPTSRRKFQRSLVKKAYPAKQKKALTTEEIFKVLGGANG